MKNIIFFGSSAYSIPSLQTLLEHCALSTEFCISCVITTKDKPAGRHLKLTPNPLKAFALEKNLPVIDNYQLSTINSNTIGLVAAFGRIIPQSVLDTFNNQIYNIHPSLLPKYRGPSPLQFQILAGLKETGVTVIQLDAEMDHGPIVAQEKDIILDSDTPETLGKRLFIKGTEVFINWLNGQMPNDQIHPQIAADATYTQKLTRQDGFITWNEYRHPTQETKLKFRAFYPWPGLWTTDPQGNRIKITQI